MHKRTLSGLGVVMAALLSAPAIAQDDGALLGLLPDDPNGFVQAVQEKLASSGIYSGPVNGTLTQATISAINAACRGAGLLPDCQNGPLSPAGSAAVVAAVAKLGQPDATVPTPEEAPAAEVVAEPAAEAETQPVSTAATTIAAADWKGRPNYGLTITPTVAGKTVEFAIGGTAEGRGSLNINASGQVSAAPGEDWSFTIDAAFTSAAGGTAVAYVGVRAADGSYITELVRGGVPIEGSGPFVVKGTTKDGAAFVQPYIQVKYPPGTAADGTLTITGASFGKQ